MEPLVIIYWRLYRFGKESGVTICEYKVWKKKPYASSFPNFPKCILRSSLYWRATLTWQIGSSDWFFYLPLPWVSRVFSENSLAFLLNATLCTETLLGLFGIQKFVSYQRDEVLCCDCLPVSCNFIRWVVKLFVCSYLNSEAKITPFQLSKRRRIKSGVMRITQLRS